MELIIDRTTRTIYESLFSTQLKNLGSPISGGQIPLSIIIVDPIIGSTIGGRVWEPVDVSTGWDWIRASIGQGNLPLLAGTFTMTFGANTTAAVPYNPTALQLANALNAIASIAAAGGVTVANVVAENGVPDPQFFVITFGSNGAQALITGDNTNLAPLAILNFGHLLTGTASRKAVQTLHISQSPAALLQTTTNLPAAGVNITVLQVGGGGQNHKIRVQLLPYPYEGTFNLTITAVTSAQISYTGLNPDGSDGVDSALEAMTSVGAGNVKTYKQGQGDFIIEFIGTKANTNMGTITGSAALLKVPPGKQGLLYLNTSAMQLLIGSSESIPAKLEVEGLQTGASAPDKFCQIDVTLLATIIDPASLISLPVPASSYYDTTASDNRYVIWRGDITSVHGGGASSLDNLATAGGVWDGRLLIDNNGGVWAMKPGTDADNGVSVIRPTDYNASTNAKVWKKII